MKELIINSKKDKGLYDVLSAVEELISQYNPSFQVNYQIEIIIEEIFINVVKHAYKNEDGIIKINYEVLDDPLRFHIIFVDDGDMFNPLEYDAPNLSDDIDERKVGSLGIYIVKEYADEMNYEYIDNQNVLSIVKNMK